MINNVAAICTTSTPHNTQLLGVVHFFSPKQAKTKSIHN
jgi:hypothetical protein